jgi:drug/metabolite transporter (DMT)-like permease
VLTLTNMFPLWVAVLSWPLLGESTPLDVWPAVIIGVLGIVLMQQPEFAGASDAQALADKLPGYIAIGAAILSSFTSAIALIGLHQVKELDSRAIVAHFSAVALAACVAALFIFPTTRPLALEPQTLLLLVGVGLSATVGQLFLTKAFAAGPPARVSVVGLAQVGIMMLLEIAFWQRSFSGLTLVGIALVIAPTAWTLLRSGTRPHESVAEVPAQ